MLDEIGMLGDLVRSRHEIYPEGVVSVALDKQFHDHSEWRLEQVLQTTLIEISGNDNSLKANPVVLMIAIENMYKLTEDSPEKFWHDFELTELEKS